MKVAILTAQSRISPVFETTSRWLVINVNNHQCTFCGTYSFVAQDEVGMSNELLTKEIQLLICGAIPCYLEKQLTEQGCVVMSFIAGDIDEVVHALCHKKLEYNPKFSMPGCKKCKQHHKNKSINNE